ncbi:glycosyltransferase family 9 protein [Spirosoma harenae]
MDLKRAIRLLKTSPILQPVLLAIDGVLWLVDTLVIWSTRRQKTEKPTLLLLKLDSLGDYLLVRNYIRLLKKHPVYQHYSFCLAGNIAFRDMAEFADTDLFDSTIWIDIYKLSTRPFYRFAIGRELRKQSFSISINPTYSRVLVLDDFMTRVAGATTRMGCETDLANCSRIEASWGNTYFTQLFHSVKEIVFEAERNRQLFSQILGETLPLLPLNLPAAPKLRIELPNSFVVISPGAGAPDKIWPMERFAESLIWLNSLRPKLAIVVTGTKGEIPLYDELRQHVPDYISMLSLMGKLSQPELVGVVKKATLVLANDSGIVHIAAAVGTPCLSLSAGKAIVRWHPYPKEIASHVRHIYPEFFDQWEGRFTELAPSVVATAPVEIQRLDVQRVNDAIRQALIDFDVLANKPLSEK